MAFTNYTDLQTSIISQCEQTGVTAFTDKVPDFIALGEGTLNRELPAIETDATLTGTISSRRIDLSSLAITQPIALFLAQSGYDEVPLQQQTDGQFPYKTTAGVPSMWSIDGANIDFDCPLNAAYPFRFRYRQKFNLATTSTNTLLTNHPDVYFAACLVWAYTHMEDPQAATWAARTDSLIAGVRKTLAKSNRGVLRVDNGLSDIGRRSVFNYSTGV